MPRYQSSNNVVDFCTSLAYIHPMTATDSIPRYKASMPAQTQFIMNADCCGDMIFTQIKREDPVALYRRTRMDGRFFTNEVVILSVVKAGTIFAKGSKPTETDYESYPGAKSWGKKGWDCPNYPYALQKFDEVVAKLAEKNRVVDDIDDADDTIVNVATIAKKASKRGRKSKKQIDIQPLPNEWTMKLLMASSGQCQANLHPIVKNWLKQKKIAVVGKIKAEGRGRPSLVYKTI